MSTLVSNAAQVTADGTSHASLTFTLQDAYGNTKAGFSVNTKINRKEFTHTKWYRLLLVGGDRDLWTSLSSLIHL